MKILHISAIGLLIVLFGLLAFFALTTPTSPKSESPGKDSSDIKSAFFESDTVYYVKSALEKDIRKDLVALLKTLKMDKGTEFDKSNPAQYLINKISKSKGAAPQYFFYKADEKTIYSFIKSRKKKKPVPERITISILYGNNPANPAWGIYHLEKKLMQDSTDVFVYTLEYKEGKYKKGIRRIIDVDLKNIVEKFAGEIQETINKNPRDAQIGGENLDFRFSLSRKDENNQNYKVDLKDIKNDKAYEKLIFPLKPIKRAIKLKKTTPYATHEVIDTFGIDEARKMSLENQLLGAFTNLFSPGGEEIFESQLKIYKNDEDISTSPLSSDYSVGKLKALLENEEYKYNSFKEWQPIFKSSLTDINFQDFIEYIKNRLEQLNKPVDFGKKDKVQYVGGKVIFVVIAIFVILIIYTSLWYFIRLKLKSESMAEDKRKRYEIYERYKTYKTVGETDHDTRAVKPEPGERTVDKRVEVPDIKFEIPEKKESIPLPAASKPIPESTTTINDQVLTGIQKEIGDIKDDVIKSFKMLLEKMYCETKEMIRDLKNAAPNDDKPGHDEEFMAEILDSNQENNRLLHKLNENIKKIIKDEKDNEASLHDLMGYINQETNLRVNKNNVLKLIDKVRAETTISKEYRLCAVNLHDDLSHLEEKYRDSWSWQLLADGFLDELKDNINLFNLKNEEAKTIYDRYFNREIPLRNIDREDIKKAIAHLHWFKFWEGLIRLGDFYNAYFDDEMTDIKFVLGYYSQKITQLLKKLGFEIKQVKPLTLIPNDYRKQNDIEQADKSYIDNFILKNLAKENNKKLQEAAANTPAGKERVIYVERLGLVDKLAEEPVNIANLRLGAYNRAALKTYASKKEKP